MGSGPKRILALGAHSDDIEIGCGGTLIRLVAERRGLEVLWAVFAANPARGGGPEVSRRVPRRPGVGESGHQGLSGRLPAVHGRSGERRLRIAQEGVLPRHPGILDALGPQDIVVANRFLCHMDPGDAERCLRNVARLVCPGGHLFVSGIDLDVRRVLSRLLGELWKGCVNHQHLGTIPSLQLPGEVIACGRGARCAVTTRARYGPARFGQSLASSSRERTRTTGRR